MKVTHDDVASVGQMVAETPRMGTSAGLDRLRRNPSGDDWSVSKFVWRQLRAFTLLTLVSFFSTHVSRLLLPAVREYDAGESFPRTPAFPAAFTAWGPEQSALDLVSDEKIHLLVSEVEDMFDRAFSGYMTHAFPMDDLKPISCSGSNSQGGMAITLLDSLDMLYLMKRDKDLRKAVLFISKSLHFDIDARVHVFEVTIRAVGGLLSGHVLLSENKTMVPWYDGELLDQAVNLADRLMPAFDTPTGVPLAWINLRSGKIPSETTDTCTACAGTMILEFGVLSRLTGNPIYEEKAKNAMRFLFSQRSDKGMVGTGLDTMTGVWSNRAAGVGASIDSYYEYLLKAYLMFGEREYLEMFVELYSSNRAYSALSERVSGMVWPVDVHMVSGRVTNPFISSLGAFWPGMQAIAGQLEDASKLFWHWNVVRKKFGVIPESFTADLTAIHPTMAYYPLRPEHIESGYILYAATRKPEYMAAVAEFHVALREKTASACGYASVGDVPTGRLDDIMESFFLSETLKYLYLLYTKQTNVLNRYVMSTEAHFLPSFPSPGGNEIPSSPGGGGGSAGDGREPPTSCESVCRRLHHKADTYQRIRQRRCDVCLALAKAIPAKQEEARFGWRAAAKHPLKANLPTSAPRALALGSDNDHFLVGVRHFLCAMTYDERTNTADCRVMREVSIEDMSSQSLQMLPPETVMFQLKGQRRREVDTLAKEIVDVLVETKEETTIPAVMGSLGDRFFPGCTTSSDMESLKASWSKEMDAIFVQDFEERIGQSFSVPKSADNNKCHAKEDHADTQDHSASTESTEITSAVTIPRIPSCQTTGRLVLAEPIDACSPLRNPELVRGGILVVQRGNCTFHSKAIHAEAANARAVIIVNGDGPPFVFEPDPQSAAGHPPVTIPCVMIGPSDGRFLMGVGGETEAPVVTLCQPTWNVRVDRAMDVLFGLDATDDPGKTCPQKPSIFSDVTLREDILFQYHSELPLQLDVVFASSFSTLHERMGTASIAPVLDKLAAFYK